MFVGIIVDMISAINMFTGQVIPAKRWLEPFLIHNQNWLGSIFFVITYGGRCIQGATATILSFCRVCAVCFPIFYQKLGQPYYIYTMQVLQLLGGLVALLLLWPDDYEYILEDNGLYSVGSDETNADWFYNFVAIMEVFFVIAIVLNNLITYTMFKLKFNKMNNVVYDNFPAWFLIAESLSLVILLAITVVSFAVYFVEIQILFTSRNTTFKVPFYRLMFVGIMVDMTSAINLFVLQIIPAREWLSFFYFTNESWLGAIFYAITYGGRCVQGATATILSFCRVSAVCFPMFYQKVRLSYAKYTYTMQAIQLSGAVAAVFLLLPREYKYVNENGGYYSAFVNNEFRKPFYNFVAVLEVFFVLAIVVNNLVTYITYKLKKVGEARDSNTNLDFKSM
ncbi:hypothetical protein GCK72_018573 [Caenorhabditis remanei]|uniref:Uncharacterized protein n=1 Tax=Caenorhabditis remanei TaxID=31234 RepID=A0A6A5GC90_CAERE|nr:hypothetical protein GCK72_018573 [Caenorhabditis remanei]KAF1752019.1 hypothetical protein GCK72_018573 [Caenorhabditis remanei]